MSSTRSYANGDASAESQALGEYAFSFLSLRLLLGVQYVDRLFANRAGQAPNDPALGGNPTASPLPLWDLGNPATWNRNATVPPASLTEASVDQTNHYPDISAYGGTTFGFFDDRLPALPGWRLTATRSRLLRNPMGEIGPRCRRPAQLQERAALPPCPLADERASPRQPLDAPWHPAGKGQEGRLDERYRPSQSTRSRPREILSTLAVGF